MGVAGRRGLKRMGGTGSRGLRDATPCFKMAEWTRLLTGSNRARVLSELKRRSVKRNTSSSMKEGAVLVPFILKDDGPDVLFTVRSKNLRQHRGQVR